MVRGKEGWSEKVTAIWSEGSMEGADISIAYVLRYEMCRRSMREARRPPPRVSILPLPPSSNPLVPPHHLPPSAWSVASARFDPRAHSGTLIGALSARAVAAAARAKAGEGAAAALQVRAAASSDKVRSPSTTLTIDLHTDTRLHLPAQPQPASRRRDSVLAVSVWWLQRWRACKSALTCTSKPRKK